VRASIGTQKFGLIDNWLRHVQDVATKYPEHLACYRDEASRVDRLCELNVIAQVINAGQTTIVQNAWERGQDLSLHGWVYGLSDGLLRDLGISLSSMSDLANALKTPWEKSKATM
jgi:carbonic anhydrase